MLAVSLFLCALCTVGSLKSYCASSLYYAMAWQNMAKTLEMLAALSSDGWETKGGKKKGLGKGSDKKGKSEGQGGTPRFCPWQCCRAGRDQKPTLGGGPQCFCCKKAWGQVPPVEGMTEQAYAAALKSKHPAAPQGKGGKGNAKGGGKGAAKTAPPRGAHIEPTVEPTIFAIILGSSVMQSYRSGNSTSCI